VGQGSIQKFFGTPYLFSAIVEASNFKCGTHPGFGTSLPKTAFWTKMGRGLGQGSIQKKLGVSYVSLQPLNLVHKLDLGLAYQSNDV